MTSLTLLAPAKVNLVLNILNKRKDGYHNLYTLFERLDLCDTVKVSKISRGIKVKSDKLITKKPQENLAYKAASLILREGRVKGGVLIEIKKRIPIAGGLGGGSSDAAAVLMGINRLYRLSFSKAELMSMGAILGADVPFFILCKSYAIGENKGDKLKPVSSRTKLWHLLVNPGFGIPTKGVYDAYDAYSSLDLTPGKRGAKIPSLLKTIPRFGYFETMMHNDLEPVVIKQKKIVGSLIKRLAVSSGHNAILSGSGPSVFCLCRTRKEAMRSKRRFLDGLPYFFPKKLKIFIVATFV